MQDNNEINIKKDLANKLCFGKPEKIVIQYSNAFMPINSNTEEVVLDELTNTPDYVGTDGSINIYISDNEIETDSNKYTNTTSIHDSLQNIFSTINKTIEDNYTEDEINNIITMIKSKLDENGGSNANNYSFLLERKDNIRYSKRLISRLLQTDFYNMN